MIEQALRDALAGDAGVSALVGTRIRPLMGAQDDVQPRLVYEVNSDQNIGTFSGPGSHNTAVVEIDAIGNTYKQCAQLSAAVKALLDFKAVVTATARIDFSKLTDETDVEQALIDGTEVQVYIRTHTFEMLYRPL